SIDRPVPYVRNARKIPQKAIDKVAGSLQEFGWRQPIVVDKEGSVIVGHTRLKAAQKLNYKEVPVHVADKLSEAQVKAYRLADNRTGEETGWDEELLSLEIKELADYDIDIDLTGFNDNEVNKLLNQYAESQQGKIGDDDIPDEIETRSQVGDLWLLGNHRVICGDSTNEENIKKLFDGQKADMMFTDPPYNVDYGGTDHPSWKRRSIQNDNMSDAQFVEFIENYLTAAKPYIKQGAPSYICYGERNSIQFLTAFKNAGLHHSSNIIWKKDSLVLGRSDYHYIHEPIFYGWFEGQKHIYYGDRKQQSVWEIKRPKRSDLHPTMKPIELIDKAMMNSSKNEDIIYEPFGGSGSTLISAEKNNRVCYAIERDPKYCDTIIQRWEDFTGNKAKQYGRTKTRQTDKVQQDTNKEDIRTSS
ncbi:MAG TPA: hypothetical protein DEG69_07635, partial [Flavobacteriaceae bacterium]|nr:hypothetical protein [Flavobacteriaceae bacterium]